jgi:hypothetical protein
MENPVGCDSVILHSAHATAFTRWLDTESRRGFDKRGRHVAVQATGNDVVVSHQCTAGLRQKKAL